MDKVGNFGLSAALALVLWGCATAPTQNTFCSTQRSLPSMGSFIQISVKHKCDDQVDAAVFVLAQKRLNAIEKQFSLYIQDSDLKRWNRGERDFSVGPDFHFLMKKATALKAETAGYFDVRVLAAKGTPVTLDGVAKGYAVDELAELLVEQDFVQYQINFSGNLRWVDQAKSGAAASSGNRHRPGHILNPKTGQPNLEKEEVLVQGPSAMLADALSTAYFSAPPSGRAEIEKKFPDYSFAVGD